LYVKHSYLSNINVLLQLAHVARLDSSVFDDSSIPLESTNFEPPPQNHIVNLESIA